MDGLYSKLSVTEVQRYKVENMRDTKDRIRWPNRYLLLEFHKEENKRMGGSE